tara:strand:+ start:18904 stop:20127 length:1224 start_codon:yes stop_codon:yes gene_type:complete
MAGPLTDMKVLDLSRILAGPWLTQILSDLGAEVWKVERPGSGDDTRHWGPPYMKDDAGNDAEDSAYFQAANRGKKSICIDIRSAEGQQVVHRLVQKADVVVENYKFGDLARYGLDYDSLAASNPAIVYCSITGYGQTGPYRERAGYDMAIQAISGLMSITGERQDRPGGGPQKVGVPIADLMTGTMSAAAVIAAYHHARKTGEGQSVDMALLDVMVTTLANQNMNYLCTGDAPRLMGNAHPNIVPYRTFQTADGNFVLAVGNDRQYAKFCEAAGCQHLATDPRYIDNANRLKNRDTLETELQGILCLKSTAQWIDELSRLGIPCAPINTLDQVFSDEQIRARDLLQHAEHKHNARMPIVSSPIKLSRTRLDTGSASPVLNQHRDYILDEVLGLSDDEKTRLAKGIPV